MKTLRLNDKELIEVDTTLVADVLPFLPDKWVVELALFSDETLPGEGIYLDRKNILRLHNWLGQVLRSYD